MPQAERIASPLRTPRGGDTITRECPETPPELERRPMPKLKRSPQPQERSPAAGTSVPPLQLERRTQTLHLQRLPSNANRDERCAAS